MKLDDEERQYILPGKHPHFHFQFTVWDV